MIKLLVALHVIFSITVITVITFHEVGANLDTGKTACIFNALGVHIQNGKAMNALEVIYVTTACQFK